MKQVLIHRSGVRADEVPAPAIEDGCVLVEVAYSLISAGTELSSISKKSPSPREQLAYQSERLENLVRGLREAGVAKTVARVRARLSDQLADPGRPIGYSCAGVVVQVGRGVEHVRPGDRVACAGAGRANHAELVLVPSNLVVKVPEGCELRDAASVAVGAIALQGVRRAATQIGEVTVVLGLGLIGQLTAQILQASGCRVYGFDLDARRVEIARAAGVHARTISEVDPVVEALHATGGHGADAVLVAAASGDSAILQQAAKMCRKKGRVVLVGAVPIELERSPLYEKEIDFLISCSYGPGRYDEKYEQRGEDYPYAWVRWTEARNMEEFLRLVSAKNVVLSSILEREIEIDRAPDAYAALTIEPRPLGVLLSYGSNKTKRRESSAPAQPSPRDSSPPPRSSDGRVGVALIGAGSFARSTLLAELENLDSTFRLRAVVSRSGATAQAAAERFSGDRAATSLEDALADDRVQAVVIATRHHLHAEQVIAAIQAGKHVYCEKPLCLTREELARILDALSLSREEALAGITTSPLVAVGFNRRFSPAARALKQALTGRARPVVLDYRVNAGFIPPDHWTHGPEGGGRLVGEACHMIDLMTHLSGSLPASLSAEGLGDRPSENASVAIRFEDGSLGTLVYTALGQSLLGKERLEAHFDGRSAVLDDFRSLEIFGPSRQELWRSPTPDKGHRESLLAFGEAIQAGGPAPISLREIVAVTEATLAFAEMAAAAPAGRSSAAPEPQDASRSALG